MAAHTEMKGGETNGPVEVERSSSHLEETAEKPAPDGSIHSEKLEQG